MVNIARLSSQKTMNKKTGEGLLEFHKFIFAFLLLGKEAERVINFLLQSTFLGETILNYTWERKILKTAWFYPV